MAFTEIYVDPSIAGDSGAGTIGDPYGDLEYAIEQETFDTTNGTRINVKSGTDEVVVASLENALADTSVSVAWVPATAAPLVIQGYTSTAGDGGIGGISGGGSVSVIFSGSHNYVFFVDMHLHNSGANMVAQMNDFSGFINCEIDNTSERGIFLGKSGIVDSCYFHNIGGSNCVEVGDCSVVSNSYFDVAGDGGNNEGCIYAEGNTNFSACLVYRNIINIDGSQRGIGLGDVCIASNNSIYSASGSGIGIWVATGRDAAIIENNLIEGFSTGDGIYTSAVNTAAQIIRGNSFYNCDTNIEDTNASHPPIVETGNETLSASPFTDAANGDFSPVDTGNVKEGALPAIIGGGLV